MNLYTIVTADQYELPVKCDLKVHEAADFLKTTPGNVRQLVFKGRKRHGYKVIVTGRVGFDNREYSKRYDMTHDRSEYFKEYYRRKVKDGKKSEKRIHT